MRIKPNLKPDGIRLELPFLDITDVPELDEFFTGLALDDVDDLVRDAASLPTVEDLMAETPSIEQDRALLLTPEERTASRLLGCYAARKPALSPEEKEALRGRMWPTPPSSPSQKTKPAVPGPDIAKIVSRWPKPLRMKYAGLVGKYSNSMPLNEAMKKAYAELRDTAEENEP